MAILLTQYGGLEIAEATEAIVRAPSLDIAGAHRLADAVAGRDSDIQFDMFNRHMLDIFWPTRRAQRPSRATRRARSRYSQATGRRSGLRWRRPETYNLDRKQHALNMIVRLQDTFRM